MDKRKRLSVARDYALTVSLGKTPTEAQEAAMREAGEISPDGRGFRFDDVSGDSWQIVPPRRGRRRAVAYTRADWEAYEEAGRLICAWLLDDAQRVADRISSAGLRNDLQEGIDGAWRERDEFASDRQRAAYLLMEHGVPGVSFEWIGDWVWAAGDTKPAREYLKAAGFRWSAKKTAWYWKPEGSRPKFRRAVCDSLDSLREHWAA